MTDAAVAIGFSGDFHLGTGVRSGWSPIGLAKKVTRASGNMRAAQPKDLAVAYEEHSGRVAQVADSLLGAIRIAHSAVSREDIICVCGSFYLVGEAKKLLANR